MDCFVTICVLNFTKVSYLKLISSLFCIKQVFIIYSSIFRYYAAPGSNYQPNVYNDIQIRTEEENNANNDHQYFEIENVQVDTDKDSNGSGFSLAQSHYIDVDILH